MSMEIAVHILLITFHIFLVPSVMQALTANQCKLYYNTSYCHSSYCSMLWQQETISSLLVLWSCITIMQEKTSLLSH